MAGASLSPGRRWRTPWESNKRGAIPAIRTRLTKHTFLDEWVKAVNAHGGFGKWQWVVSKNPADVVGILDAAASA